MSAPSADEFRRVMARVPTPVTIVTAPGAEAAAGATANAVASLSLDPPLMLACLDRRSRTLGALRTAGRFAVNVLGAEGESHARAFATQLSHAEKWQDVPQRDESGVPVLAEALVWVVCELRDLLDGGDHVIVTGAVEAFGSRDGSPLLFHEGGYRPL